MARDLSLLLIVDVEATCWQGEPPPGEEAEIIEVGVVVLDVASMQILQTDDLFVKPARSKVSPYCTQLTTITQAQADAGMSFPDLCRTLKKRYLGPERAWASWGDFDRMQFERQCRSANIGYPFSKTHLNIKNLYSVCHALPEELGMDAALAHAGLKLEGTHHRGADDAKNIARLMAGLLRKFRT